jgi:hypothetical protein
LGGALRKLIEARLRETKEITISEKTLNDSPDVEPVQDGLRSLSQQSDPALVSGAGALAQ